MNPSSAPTATVWCRSERHYAERPVAFLWEGQRRRVVRVVAQWREPAGPAFHVLADDNWLYELRYDEAHQTWTITPRLANAPTT